MYLTTDGLFGACGTPSSLTRSFTGLLHQMLADRDEIAAAVVADAWSEPAVGAVGVLD
jgi:hypothetical protein